MLGVGCGIPLYRFLIIADLSTLKNRNVRIHNEIEKIEFTEDNN